MDPELKSLFESAIWFFSALIGGGGIVELKRRGFISFRRNNGPPDTVQPCGLQLSDKTGGAKRISEEALGKINEINKKLVDDFLTEEKHGLMCKLAASNMREHITKEFGDHTEKILAAIEKINGD